ncbi:hypothetical protein HDU99_006433, partial [Rhizoclosmatium hyalinum]
VEKQETEIQGLNNKVTLLTSDLERAQKRADDSTSALRTLEVQAEQYERKARQLESEKAALEAKHDDLNEKHTALKTDFETTMKSLESM